MNYYLVGLPGVGKTHCGRILSDHLRLEFIDLDNRIEEETKKTISQLFEEEGELHFRELETQVLRKISTQDGIVVATGGGTPCFNNNLSIMMSQGVVLYLRDEIDAIASRIVANSNKRPMFFGLNEDDVLLKLMDLRDKRRPHYEQTHVITGLESFHKLHLLTNRLELFTKPLLCL